MKALALGLAVLSSSAFANNLCTKYDNRSEYINALTALVTHMDRSLEEVCSSPRILDIEIQPSQIINREGQAVPQFAVYFHYNEESCKYLLNRETLTLTSSRCFPTW